MKRFPFNLYGNLIDYRDLKTAGCYVNGLQGNSNDVILVPANSVVDNIQELISPYKKNEIGFVIGFYGKSDSASAGIHWRINDCVYYDSSFNYHSIVPVLDKNIRIDCFNGTGSNRYVTAMIIYIPKDRFSCEIPGEEKNEIEQVQPEPKILGSNV